MMNNYDVIVIGAGVAGMTVARKTAQSGLKVALIENNLIGGRSLQGGGLFIHHIFQSLKTLDRSKYITSSNIIGPNTKFELDYPNLIRSYHEKKNKIQDNFLSDISIENLYYLQGKAKLTSKQSIDLDGQILYAKHIILANGSQLKIPNYDGLNEALQEGFVIEPTQIQNVFTKPTEVVILGGGRISYELAYFYTSIGTKVTTISNSFMLHAFDTDIRNTLTERIKNPLIELIKNPDYIAFKNRSITYTSDGITKTLTPDHVILATGYGLNHDVLGNVNLLYNDLGIITDDHLRTNIDTIYAIGDVNDKTKLSGIAIEEALVAANNIIGIPTKMKYHRFVNSLMGVFEYAYIGLTENEVIASKEPFYVAKFSLSKEKRLFTKLDTPLIKVIMSKVRNEILGLHIVGHEAVDELTQLYHLLEPRSDRGILITPIYTTLNEINDQINHIKKDYHHQLIEHMYSVYQVIYSNKSHEVVGYESLSRFIIDDQVHNTLPIIEMLEKSGYIRNLDERSVDNAIHLLKKIKLNNINISINIASHTLLNTPSQYFKDIILKAGLQPNNITFEVTERQLINHTRILNALHSLKKDGFRISLDDFSVGHASLVLLDKFSFDEIKIDRALLPKNAEDMNAISTYKYLVELIKQYHVDIVSEGIETEFQYNFIQGLNVDYIQGYYLGKPEKI